MTARLLGELVGGPHDGYRFDLNGLLRAFPGEQVPRLPEALVIGLPGAKPIPHWPDSVHCCFGMHIPLCAYSRRGERGIRYRYVGIFPCMASRE